MEGLVVLQDISPVADKVAHILIVWMLEENGYQKIIVAMDIHVK